MTIQRVPSLHDALAEVSDFRQASGRRYDLLAVLLLSCVAMMSGARSQSAIADWGKNYGQRWLKLLGINRPRGPSQPTVHRIFKGVDACQVERAITLWADAMLRSFSVSEAALEALAIDGKSLRGSHKQGAKEDHLVSALSHRLGVVVAQIAVADKSKENGCLEPLLEAIVLEGRVITTDALHTTRAVAQKIIEGGGDYLQPVKANQPTLLEDIREVFNHAEELKDTITKAQTTDQHADRIETRSLRTSTALQDYLDWPGHAQVLELRRVIVNKHTRKTRHELVYGITSLPPAEASAKELLKLWREHWHIENKLHYVRDVTFDEDRSQVRSESVPQVMAALRNLAISVMRLCGADNIAAACRRYAANPTLAFAAIGLIKRE
jgi:predicted transposase YbfD/YdcC